MNAARISDPCPIKGCGRPLRKPRLRTSQKSLVCEKGHYVVDLDQNKVKR